MGRRVLSLAAVVAALMLLSSSAGASDFGGWMISSWSGNTFSGKFRNETKDPINGVAVGTALKEGNPITAFDIENLKCQLYAAYGSAFCYVSLLIQPGATVAFHGTSKNKLTPAGLQMCSSADKGMDNTCVNVPLSSKGGSVLPVTTTAGGSNPKAAAVHAAAVKALGYVNNALEDEANAAKELGGDLSLAHNYIENAIYFLEKTAKLGFQSTLAENEVKHAISSDKFALDGLEHGKRGTRIAVVRGWLKSATEHKNAAVRYLTSLAR